MGTRLSDPLMILLSENWGRRLDLAHSQEENNAETKAGAIAIKSFALLGVLGAAYCAMAQDATTPYPNMAPIE